MSSPDDDGQQGRMEALGQLAGGIAHDFNNLLAVILSYAELVRDEGRLLDSAEVVADAEQILRAAERAARLTRRLLTFARREVIQPTVLDLNGAVVRVQEMLTHTIGTDVELSTSLAVGLWPVLADAGQVEQVLMNLAINARDAMPQGGVLRIDTANVDPEPPTAGRYVRLRVSDTGQGIPADVMAHMFDPFYTTKAAGAGTGLGLATVHRIVTASGATIDAESEPGVGTVFTVLWPATDQPATQTEPPAEYRRTPAGETVLVVDDEADLREVTARIFTRHGYRVLSAANGADAVRIAEQHQGNIHLLVTDVVMPGMLGREVAERVVAAQPSCEVLFMSGYARPVLASQGRLEPGVALVDKPFTAAGLMEAAGKVLNGHFRGFRTIPPSDR